MAKKPDTKPTSKDKSVERVKAKACAELRDDERGIGKPIVYSAEHFPMQSAPDHGPHK